jgi:MOSC domain-containing protein YiiM
VGQLTNSNRRIEQFLPLAQALKLLRTPDHRLMLMHTRTGTAYYVVPGGRVSKEDALKIIQRPDVQPFDDGLFPGCSQTWRLGG